MTDFIGVYDQVLTPEYCRQLIRKFEGSEHKAAGQTGQGVDLARKDSTDITITSFPEWREDLVTIQTAVLAGLVRYVREHPFLLVGALALARQDPETGTQIPIRHEDIAGFTDADIGELVKTLYRLGAINLQKYRQGQGGYHHWHSELYPHPQDPGSETLHRTLLWMFYLNDVEEGGETSFYFQDRHIAPKQGTLVIAPAAFTHTHKGQVPRSGDKYILTSWLLFQRAEKIYGQGS